MRRGRPIQSYPDGELELTGSLPSGESWHVIASKEMVVVRVGNRYCVAAPPEWMTAPEVRRRIARGI